MTNRCLNKTTRAWGWRGVLKAWRYHPWRRPMVTKSSGRATCTKISLRFWDKSFMLPHDMCSYNQPDRMKHYSRQSENKKIRMECQYLHFVSLLLEVHVYILFKKCVLHTLLHKCPFIVIQIGEYDQKWKSTASLAYNRSCNVLLDRVTYRSLRIH